MGATPAMAADLNSYSWGTYQQAHAYSYGTNTSVAIKDTRADARTVYTEYYRSVNNDMRTLHNKSGNGTTVYSASGSTIWKLRACQSIEWSPDSCGSWASSR